MDFIKKQYFWIVCGLVTVVALGAWVWTLMDMSARRAADQAKIDAALNTLNQVNGIQDHPNEITHSHMEQRIEDLKVSVRQAWQDQYTQQVNVFVWPKQFPAAMRNDLARYRPIETWFPVFPTPPAKEVDQRWRVFYADYMREELPKLAEIIGAEWNVNTDAATTGSGSEGYTPYSTTSGYPSSSSSFTEGSGLPGAMEEERPVVEWNAGNQQEIYNLRFNWAASPNQVPTTLQMLYAQEDFWTLQSMMEIIRRTNGDADAYYEALVKEIQFIRIGAAAVPSDARITPLLGAGAGTGTEATMGPEGMPVEGSGSGSDPYGMPQPGMPTPGMPGGELDGAGGYGSGSGMTPLVAIDPAEGRYVDNAYKPLSAQELRASLTTTDPTKAYLAVAKRMPVRMRVRMDQRYLSRLLIECANAPLTVEVRQVRINPGTSGAAGSGYGSSYGGSGGSSSYSMPSVSSSGFGALGGGSSVESISGESSYGSGSGTGGPGPGSSFDAIVEIYGIVYIYNPPVEGPLQSAAPAGSESAPAAPAGDALTSVE